MRPHCWVMVALAGIMSYLSPERALGAPQREGEQSRGWRGANLSVVLENGGERGGQSVMKRPPYVRLIL